MRFRNPFDIAPIRPVPLPGQIDPTGELESTPDALLDSEQAPPPPAGEPLAVEFVGNAAEYARIWYVNLLLTLVTLGIWSAWAKVASRRYFASRTLIGRVPFAYHAAPLPILRGRLLAAAIIAAGWMASTAVPILQPVLLILAILAAPWFLLRTFEFDARNYSWRGIRFGFAAPYRAAVVAILPLLVWPLSELAFRAVGMVSTGSVYFMAELWVPLAIFALLWPRTIAAMTHLRFEGTRYGTVLFVLDATAKDFYLVYFRGVGIFAVVLIGGAGIVSAIISSAGDPEAGALANAAIYLVATAIVVGYARGRRFNLGLHRLVGDGRIRFRSTLDPKALANLYMRNALWLIATAGLAAPWRRVATVRMRARHVTVYVDGGFAAIGSVNVGAVGPLGESVAEGFNLDLSL